MDAGTLHEALTEVCPITGVSVGKTDDRATWTFIPAESATQAEIDAGNNVVATIPVDPDQIPERVAERARRDGFKNDAGAVDLLDKASKRTSAEIDAWLAANMTTVAQARQVVGALIKGLIARGLI